MQLIVMGMHRAGTSVLARLLNMMGAYYGPEGIHFGASSENAKGFWERKDVLELHQNIFKSQGIDWDKPTALNVTALLENQEHAQSIKNLLLELEAHRPWMLKDPRMCLLFPLWKPLLEMPVCIHINRPPIQVAQSLHQRSGMPLHVGVALWEFYNIQAFSASVDVPRILIQHQALMTEPSRVISELHQQLSDLNVQGLRLPSAQEIEAFVDTKLFRQKGTEALQQAFCNTPQLELQRLMDSGDILQLKADTLPDVSQGAMQILEQYQQKHAAAQAHQQLQEEMQALRDTAREHYQSFIQEHQALEQQKYNAKVEMEQLQQQSQQQLVEQSAIFQVERDALSQKNQRQQASISQQQQDKLRLEAAIAQLNADLYGAGQQQQQQQTQYQQWLRSLDEDIQATFASFTWKLGNGIVTLIRKILFINSPTATDHIQTTLAEIRQQGMIAEKKNP